MKKITLLPLIAAIFFMVSGGPYGLEELVQSAGYETSLLVLGLTPLFFSLPTALLVGELSARIPDEGGYYVWVRRTLGPAWGFQEAWLSLVASFFDMAIYPTLFVAYLGRLWPSLASGWCPFALGTALITACTLWNLRGARAVGRGSLWLGAAVLGPFVALCVAAPFHAHVAEPIGSGTGLGLAGGLLVALWNFMGWDNASTLAAEVEKPERTYPTALLVTVAVVTLSYALPVLAAWHVGIAPREFSTGAWVIVGQKLGGSPLGVAIVLGGAVSAAGMFNALLLSCSRIPLVLARDGLFPAVFARTRGPAEVPVWAVVTCSAVYACCLGLGFSRLVLLDLFFYGLGLALEFVSLIVLRLREPRVPLAFRIPARTPLVIGLALFPIGCLMSATAATLVDSTHIVVATAAVLLLTGPILFLAVRYRRVPLHVWRSNA